jgi:hypothetical protein
MSLSDVVSVNNLGAHFKKNFCVTVDNTDGFEVLGHATGNKVFGGQDAIKGNPLPPTVVCADRHKANTYLRAFGEPKVFGEFVDIVGQCGVSEIRQVVQDAWSLKSQNPTMSTDDISDQLETVCDRQVIDRIIDNVVGESETAEFEPRELHCGKINEGYEVLCGTSREFVLREPFEDVEACTHEVRTAGRFSLARDNCAD